MPERDLNQDNYERYYHKTGFRNPIKYYATISKLSIFLSY